VQQPAGIVEHYDDPKMMASQKVHLRRYAHASSLRRTHKYASFLGIRHALHLELFALPSQW
jgi:hypothetical protein